MACSQRVPCLASASRALCRCAAHVRSGREISRACLALCQMCGALEYVTRSRSAAPSNGRTLLAISRLFELFRPIRNRTRYIRFAHLTSSETPILTLGLMVTLHFNL